MHPVEVTPVSRKGWMLFVALCVIWGIPYLLIRVAVRELPPPALVFLRTAPAALLLAPLALHRGELRPLLARWRWVVAYTVVEIAIPWLLLFHAELRLSSSLAALLVGAVPLIATVLYRAVGAGEHFDARRLTGLFIGFAGADRRRLRAGGPALHAGVGLGGDGRRRRRAGARLHRARLPLVLRADPRSGALKFHSDHVRQPARGSPPRRHHPRRAAHAGHRRRHAAHPSRLGAGDGALAEEAGRDAGRTPLGPGDRHVGEPADAVGGRRAPPMPPVAPVTMTFLPSKRGRGPSSFAGSHPTGRPHVRRGRERSSG